MAQRSGRGASEASWKAALGLSRPVPTFPGCGTPGSVPAAQTLLCPPISRGPRCPEGRAGRGSACARSPAAWEQRCWGWGQTALSCARRRGSAASRRRWDPGRCCRGVFLPLEKPSGPQWQLAQRRLGGSRPWLGSLGGHFGSTLAADSRLHGTQQTLCSRFRRTCRS